MTLSDEIIYGSVDSMISLIQMGATLDEIDEYGYTPLIQTAIVNDPEKTQAILSAGAELELPDLTGRTALHWAADNNNLELCKLLLNHQANPNAYTTAGQPVLALPFLRKQKKIEKLLRSHGANIDFANDFINAKLLGHRFELTSQVDIVDHEDKFVEIDFEGFYLESTISLILHSLLRFRNHYFARGVREYFDYFNMILMGFVVANQLAKYQHYTINKKAHDQQINELLDTELLMLPIAYEGHAITFIKYGPLLARCDRGIYGRKHGAVIIYMMNHPQALTKEFIKDLLYAPQSEEFMTQGIEQALALTPIATLPLSLQITGNCSWANVEATIPTMMLMLCLTQHVKHLTPNTIEMCKKSAIDFYEMWMDWDKHIALHHFIANFDTVSETRQASRVSILAAILFQACNNDNPKDLDKIKKILPIVKLEKYGFILKSYVYVFCKDPGNAAGKKFSDILDDFGVDINKF